MNQRHLWTAAGIIACIILIVFALSVPHTRDARAPRQTHQTTPVLPAVAVHDSYKKGVHTLTGSVMAPNACGTVSAAATAAGGGINIAVIMQTEPGICLQVPARETFSAAVAAPPNVPITATINGARATTTAL